MRLTSHKLWRPGAQGLEEQLLNVVARHERPELEAERGALAARVGADRAQLAALEAALLSGLARASGNILDNQARPRPCPARSGLCGLLCSSLTATLYPTWTCQGLRSAASWTTRRARARPASTRPPCAPAYAVFYCHVRSACASRPQNR